LNYTTEAKTADQVIGEESDVGNFGWGWFCKSWHHSPKINNPHMEKNPVIQNPKILPKEFVCLLRTRRTPKNFFEEEIPVQTVFVITVTRCAVNEW